MSVEGWDLESLYWINEILCAGRSKRFPGKFFVRPFDQKEWTFSYVDTKEEAEELVKRMMKLMSFE